MGKDGSPVMQIFIGLMGIDESIHIGAAGD